MTKPTSDNEPNGNEPRKPPQPVSCYIGEYADYLVCDPDGITTPDGLPRMEPPAAAFQFLAYLQEMYERITGAPAVLAPGFEAMFGRPKPGARTAAGHEQKPHITCPQCHLTSYHREDVRQRFCGNCHEFHEDMKL